MNTADFFATLRQKGFPVFGRALRQEQVAGIETILRAAAGLDVTFVAYLLATAYLETGQMMQPIKETVLASHRDRDPSDATVVARLDAAFAKGQLRWVKSPYWRPDDDGKAWFGRGFVQLTHKDNYRKASRFVGLDLVADPRKAMDPELAAKILVGGCVSGMFTGKKLGDYLPGDYVGARRVVNGTDRAADIAGYARAFERALRGAGYEAAVPTPSPAAIASLDPAPQPGLIATILALLARIFGSRK